MNVSWTFEINEWINSSPRQRFAFLIQFHLSRVWSYVRLCTILIRYRARPLTFNVVQFNLDSDRFVRRFTLFYRTWHRTDIPGVMVSIYWLQIARTYAVPKLCIRIRDWHAKFLIRMSPTYIENYTRDRTLLIPASSNGLSRKCTKH